jgi:hypothetical protein
MSPGADRKGHTLSEGATIAVNSHRRSGRPPTILLAPALLAAVLAIALVAGCSSSKKAPATSSSPPTTSAPPAAGSGSAADIAAIKSAYMLLFAPSTPVDTSVTMLQDGADFRATLVSEAKTTYAKEASVSVSKVTVTSANRASVTFSVLLNKSPILPNQPGYAIREDGHWKVAGATFCALLTAEGNAPAACKTAVATSLPS